MRTKLLPLQLVIAAGAVAGCIIHDSGAGAGGAVGGNMIPASSVQPLKQAGAAAHRRIGTALMSHHLSNAQVRALVVREFDSLTPENEMKWGALEPQPGRFDFDAADRLVSFAAENGIRMRGHTLVWHNQLGHWVKGMRADALRAAMARHIQNVVGHWKGKIAQWDVVNEAIVDGPGGELRSDSPFAVLGPTFIDEAFRLAHAADPQAQLFYNDYEIEGGDTPKGEAAYALCKRLKQAGVPIHGIGFQMHVDPRAWPSADQMRRNFERYAALGLAIEITEMDVAVGEIPGTIEEKLQRQREITRDIVAACVAVDKCSGITFWGATDSYSWLNSAEWGRLRGKGPHYPLPFNVDLQPKPMAAGIVEALGGAAKAK
jgi:endo-1,4-beta-xylanase